MGVISGRGFGRDERQFFCYWFIDEAAREFGNESQRCIGASVYSVNRAVIPKSPN
jgi:hypothetical protein